MILTYKSLTYQTDTQRAEIHQLWDNTTAESIAFRQSKRNQLLLWTGTVTDGIQYKDLNLEDDWTVPWERHWINEDAAIEYKQLFDQWLGEYNTKCNTNVQLDIQILPLE